METATQEKTHHWSDIDNQLQLHICRVHAEKLNTKNVSVVRRIFELAQPQIIIGVSVHKGPKENSCYFRIHQDSIDLVKLLIKNFAHYLK